MESTFLLPVTGPAARVRDRYHEYFLVAHFVDNDVGEPRNAGTAELSARPLSFIDWEPRRIATDGTHSLLDLLVEPYAESALPVFVVQNCAIEFLLGLTDQP